MIYTYNLLPLLIDEVNPKHFSEKTLEEVLKHTSENKMTKRALILTFNLEEFLGKLQVLRRVCFLHFENQVNSEVNAKTIEKIMRGLDNSLFLMFLNYLNEKKIEINLDTKYPLKIAREFLLNEGVPVPENYQGRYEEVIRKSWRILYQSSPEIFEEAPEANEKHEKGKKVKAFKVKKEKVGFLIPLESFEINSTFPDYYILDKEKIFRRNWRKKYRFNYY